jgi:ribosomal protein S18 acetylase RimI-like enzyme
MTLFTADAAVRNPGRDEAVEFLMRDRAWSAYALGYIDPSAGVPTSVLTAGSGGETESILVQAQLPQLLSLFAGGRREGIESTIEALPATPASGVFSIRGDAVAAFESHLNVTTAHKMRRMVVRPGQLRPRRAGSPVRLGLDDIDPVKRLYGMWTDAHQLPGQLSTGVYFGVYARDELIAVAGTHCVSREFGVGAIGNVLTHSDYRHRGLASATTTAVAEELFRLGCEDVVLNVRDGNEIAYRTYLRLGFVDHCTFIEGVFHSRAGRR